MLARKSALVITTPGESGMSEAAVVVEKVGDLALFGLEVVACVVWVATDAEDSFRALMNPAGNIVVEGESEERMKEIKARNSWPELQSSFPWECQLFLLSLLSHFSIPTSTTDGRCSLVQIPSQACVSSIDRADTSHRVDQHALRHIALDRSIRPECNYFTVSRRGPATTTDGQNPQGQRPNGSHKPDSSFASSQIPPRHAL